MLIYSLFVSIVFFLSGSLTVFCNDTNSNEICTVFQNTLSHIRPRISSEEQANAAAGVVERLLGPERAKNFVMMVNPNFTSPGKDSFLIKKNSMGQVEILGTSGVVAAWGLHYYLKTYCNVHISWEGNQVELPDILPDVRVKISSNDRFRYYQNVCTLGYTSAWWQWEDWEKNIDWMALNGINLALAFTGQEAIWQKVYLRLNFTMEEINEHFGGPGFLPWSRMGNMRGFGGPLNSNWHDKSIRLQHRILERMRALGIIPVLPAFAGHVPRALLKLFPKANVTKSAVWNNFSDKYCCPYLLEPTDPLFKQIGQQFLKTYIEEFGTDHVYNCDTFNENEPYTSELKFLRNIGHSIFEAMNSVDSKAIWLMQGWLFYHDSVFWTEPRTRTFLTSVPLGRMIVLDLQSEQFPQYKRLNSYYGQPFIWCMLHNFGGTLGMFGSAEIINHRVFEARNMNGSTMVGTGLTPEGINQNYVIYELMNEMAYRKKPVNLDKWFENFANRRYGDIKGNEHTVTAWKGFKNTVYNFSDTRRIRGKYVITIRPNLNFFHGDGIIKMHLSTTESFNKKNIDLFKQNAKLLLALFDDLEEILASSEDFLLGKWLKMAKDLATDDEEEILYEYNARNQITLWGPLGEIRDYANKQWSGIVADYFKPRWAIFLNELETSLTTGTRVNTTRINKRIFENVEKAFTFSRKIYPTKATGDSIDIAERILSEWYDPHLPFHKTSRHNYKQYWSNSYY
ncbi:alpha-N-acetylglucosaminidase isoform X1 [Apis mellifera carnica]|nr:alpha-N-acetylglucosaminidase isoform X1 [Apis mellifera carnica]